MDEQYLNGTVGAEDGRGIGQSHFKEAATQTEEDWESDFDDLYAAPTVEPAGPAGCDPSGNFNHQLCSDVEARNSCAGDAMPLPAVPREHAHIDSVIASVHREAMIPDTVFYYNTVQQVHEGCQNGLVGWWHICDSQPASTPSTLFRPPARNRTRAVLSSMAATTPVIPGDP
jgi:hypothetical protein